MCASSYKLLYHGVFEETSCIDLYHTFCLIYWCCISFLYLYIEFRFIPVDTVRVVFIHFPYNIIISICVSFFLIHQLHEHVVDYDANLANANHLFLLPAPLFVSHNLRDLLQHPESTIYIIEKLSPVIRCTVSRPHCLDG